MPFMPYLSPSLAKVVTACMAGQGMACVDIGRHIYVVRAALYSDRDRDLQLREAGRFADPGPVYGRNKF
jgi:methylthioribose-1-phosphate isomerase